MSAQQLALLPGYPEWVTLPAPGGLRLRVTYDRANLEDGDDETTELLTSLGQLELHPTREYFEVNTDGRSRDLLWLRYYGGKHGGREGGAYIQGWLTMREAIAAVGEPLAGRIPLPASVLDLYKGMEFSIARDHLVIREDGGAGREFATVFEALAAKTAGFSVGGQNLETGVWVLLYFDGDGHPLRFSARLCPVRTAERYLAEVRSRLKRDRISATTAIAEATQRAQALAAIAEAIAAHGTAPAPTAAEP